MFTISASDTAQVLDVPQSGVHYYEASESVYLRTQISIAAKDLGVFQAISEGRVPPIFEIGEIGVPLKANYFIPRLTTQSVPLFSLFHLHEEFYAIAKASTIRKCSQCNIEVPLVSSAAEIISHLLLTAHQNRVEISVSSVPPHIEALQQEGFPHHHVTIGDTISLSGVLIDKCVLTETSLVPLQKLFDRLIQTTTATLWFHTPTSVIALSKNGTCSSCGEVGVNFTKVLFYEDLAKYRVTNAQSLLLRVVDSITFNDALNTPLSRLLETNWGRDKSITQVLIDLYSLGIEIPLTSMSNMLPGGLSCVAELVARIHLAENDRSIVIDGPLCGVATRHIYRLQNLLIKKSRERAVLFLDTRPIEKGNENPFPPDKSETVFDNYSSPPRSDLMIVDELNLYQGLCNLYLATNAAKALGVNFSSLKRSSQRNIGEFVCEKCRGLGSIQLLFSKDDPALDLPKSFSLCDACEGARFKGLAADLVFRKMNLATFFSAPLSESKELIRILPRTEKIIRGLEILELLSLSLGTPLIQLTRLDLIKIRLVRAVSEWRSSHGKSVSLHYPSTGFSSAERAKLLEFLKYFGDLGIMFNIVSDDKELKHLASTS